MRSWPRYILAICCGAFLVLFLLVPLARAIQSGFFDEGRPTLFWLKQVFIDLNTAPALLNGLKVAVCVTLGTFLVAVPLALLAHHYDFRGKRLAAAMLMVPMILPPFVGALAMKKFMALHGGSFNLILDAIGLGPVDWRGGGLNIVVILEILHLYPIMYLNAAAALANVDPTMVEASRNLGASRWSTFWRVILPLISPGLFAGGTIVFIWSFTELGTPLMVGYEQMLPVQIFRGLNELETPAKVYSMVFVMLSGAVFMYALGRVLFGRSAGAMVGRGAAAIQRKCGPAATVGVWLAFGGVTLVAVLPHIGVVLLALAERWGTTILPSGYTLRHMAEVFGEPRTWNSIVNSLRYASAATAVDIVLGLAIAFLAVRLRVRGGSALDAMAMLPLAVPGLVIASGYVIMTRKGALLEAIGPAHDPTMILIIAYSVRRLPYMVRSISAGLRQTSVTLEEAARNLGAGPFRAAMRITVPLIYANVLAGSILAFSFSMLEVSDSLILAQAEAHYPITKEIYSLVSLADMTNRAAALGTFGMLLLTGTLILANLLLGRKLGALFRV
ncbi:MAG: ABC transporter permease [Planctomycetota bacterium]|jgi:iron(III) transport system permease protein